MKNKKVLTSAMMMMLLAIFGFAQVNGATKTVNLTPTNDAFLQGNKGQNINLIRVEPKKRTGYLMFDLSSVDGTIKSAKLKLKCTSDAGSGNIKINLGKTNNWTEKNLNGKNKPAPGAQLATLNKPYKVGSVYTWNLNAAQLKGGKVSLIVTQVSGNDVAFGSKENKANKPVLEITYTTGGGVADCAGVIGGSAYIDDCGDCVGGTTGKEPCVVGDKDCAGVVGGTAYIDDCGECVGGTTGKEPCTPGGISFIDYSAYTIGSSHDGNQHDKDDILAAPMVIALVSQAGVTGKFVHMDYSNHLGNNSANMAKDMATSVNGACEKWGVPKNKTFDCQKNLNGAVNSIKNAINAAKPNKRFFYACGGPMEVPWRGINASNAANRKNTTAISHSDWNNKHSDTPQMNHTWNDIKKTGVKTVDISNQNQTAFNVAVSEWNWLKAKGGKYAWLHSRNKKSKFDGSDAGMVWYIITGRGDQKAKMERIKQVFNGTVVKPKDCAGVPGGSAYIDDCGDCVG
ncbi:MAG: hypothetical protein MI922_05315, partial [Bacteroidales bacterium]|nr:hypothetical protein [Bacteroidales bacterium]